MKIGFIGLGHMGDPMASNLLKHGHELYVYDLSQTAVKVLVQKGARAVSSIAELMQYAGTVITSVQTSQQVTELCLSPGGIFSQGRQKLLYIDCSSIDVTTSRYLHTEALKLQIAMLDAPVSGGTTSAAAGTLTIMAGGEEAAYKQGLPILKCMGKKIVHTGPGGSGQAAKICNNLLLAISMIGTCEAFALAKKLGLDQKKFFEISSNASGQCWSMTSYCPVPYILEDVPANKGYQPGFMAKMMLKDLRLAQHSAEAVDACIPLGANAAELYELFIAKGFGEKDFSAMYEFIASSE